MTRDRIASTCLGANLMLHKHADGSGAFCPTMFIPFMLPEFSIALTIAGPVMKHNALQVREEA